MATFKQRDIGPWSSEELWDLAYRMPGNFRHRSHLGLHLK